MSPDRGDALIFFCRLPRPGKVKTRLASAIGPAAAAGLYSCFLRDLRAAAGGCAGKVFVFYAPPAGDGAALRRLLRLDAEYLCQRGPDLGARMRGAFERVFGAGFERAVIIGSDTPDLSAPDLRKAFQALRSRKAVIGPAEDGGYYLLGFRREAFLPEVFSGIEWSGPAVLAETLARFTAAGIAPKRLRVRRDIDTVEDLRVFYLRNKRGTRAPRTMKDLSRRGRRLFQAAKAGREGTGAR